MATSQEECFKTVIMKLIIRSSMVSITRKVSKMSAVRTILVVGCNLSYLRQQFSSCTFISWKFHKGQPYKVIHRLLINFTFAVDWKLLLRTFVLILMALITDFKWIGLSIDARRWPRGFWFGALFIFLPNINTFVFNFLVCLTEDL